LLCESGQNIILTFTCLLLRPLGFIAFSVHAELTVALL